MLFCSSSDSVFKAFFVETKEQQQPKSLASISTVDDGTTATKSMGREYQSGFHPLGRNETTITTSDTKLNSITNIKKTRRSFKRRYKYSKNVSYGNKDIFTIVGQNAASLVSKKESLF